MAACSAGLEDRESACILTSTIDVEEIEAADVKELGWNL